MAGKKVISAQLPNSSPSALIALSTPSSGDKELGMARPCTQDSFSIPAPEGSFGFGKSLLGADIDGDTWTDIIVGAPYTDKPFRLSGHIYVYLGRTLLERREAENTEPDLVISSPSSGNARGKFI